ncbi:MAG: elongation factor G [Clostridia bacterium]
MKVYEGKDIRNVAVAGHSGSGKTEFIEAALFKAGVTDRWGKISEGNTVCDYDAEEIKRQMSVNCTVAPFSWSTAKIADTKVNLIDTPGYFDFVGDVKSAVRVADSVLIVVNGKEGVEVGAEFAWQYATEQNKPKMIFVNNMDDTDVSFRQTLTLLRDKFGTSIAPFRVPTREDGSLTGYVNIVSGKAYSVKGETEMEVPIPHKYLASYEGYHDILVEAAAMSDDDLMEKYLGGEQITDEEMRGALKKGVKSGDIVPVYGGSATSGFAIRSVMDAILKYLPSPVEANNEAVDCDSAAPVSLITFKTIADQYVGKISMFKVASGILKSDSSLYNPRTGEMEKLGKIYVMCGKKQEEVSELHAGDIGAVTKVNELKTGDTLCEKGSDIELEGIKFAKPMLSMAIRPMAKGDEEKINASLARLMEEDPTFTVEQNTLTGQMILSGKGEQHLDIICSKLKSKFGIGVDLINPKVAYRETIKKTVTVQGRHKKQSGGHGQFGDVWIEFSPSGEEGLIFDQRVVGGAVPKNFFPAVEKGLQECMAEGVLGGFPVTGIKAVLTDGSYHPVDSSEMAFKIAASIAFKEGTAQAQPVLLEPIGTLEVTVPSKKMGDVIGDLNKRRGRILEMNEIGNNLGKVVAEVPMSEMTRYAIDLRSMTKGRGQFDFEFVRYEEVPAQNVAKILADRNR